MHRLIWQIHTETNPLVIQLKICVCACNVICSDPWGYAVVVMDSQALFECMAVNTLYRQRCGGWMVGFVVFLQ